MAKNNSDPVGTLSIGNIVTAGTILYKSNFKRYLQVSFRATLWGIAIVLLTMGLSFIGGILLPATRSWLMLIPLGLGWLVITLYCLAKYATDRAIICRLAYQESIDRPETVTEATKQLLPRTWGFLRLSWLLGLYLCLVTIASLIAVSVVSIGVMAFIMYGLKITPDYTINVLVGLFFIGLFFLSILVIIRYYAVWFIGELSLAIEPTKSARFSLRRSRKLSKISINRIILVLAIAFSISLPINLIGSIPVFIGRIMANPLLLPDPSTQLFGNMLIVAGIILSAIGELLIMPFWQAIKAVIYYDLCNRQEGKDLIL